MDKNYISKNVTELINNSPEEIKAFLLGEELSSQITFLGNKYKLPISSYTTLYNIVFLTIIGAIIPSNVLTAITDLLKMDEDSSAYLAKDLESGIFEYARSIILKKNSPDMVTLEFGGQKSKEDLRKEILDTTKRESAITKEQSSPLIKRKPTVLNPGTRPQLIEHMQILDNIPTNEEIEERLKLIKEQIESINKKEKERTLETSIPPQKFEFGEVGKTVVKPETKSASYSKAPTVYNVDPYREVTE